MNDTKRQDMDKSILESRIAQLEKSLSGRRRGHKRLTDLVKKQQKRIAQQDKILNSLEFHNKLSAQMKIDRLKKQKAAGVEIVDLLRVVILSGVSMDKEELDKVHAWLKENKHE